MSNKPTMRIVIDCDGNAGLVDALIKEYKYYDPIEPSKPNSYMCKSIEYKEQVVTIVAVDFFHSMFGKLADLVKHGQIKSFRVDQGART